MTLNEIRKAYDENYQNMQEVIRRMGGDGQIKFHRKNKTPLYQKLIMLQKKEHRLTELENQMRILEPSVQ
jgi:hypothetical protein